MSWFVSLLLTDLTSPCVFVQLSVADGKLQAAQSKLAATLTSQHSKSRHCAIKSETVSSVTDPSVVTNFV